MSSYIKNRYDTIWGYSLHHTKGISAEDSTIRYLHHPSEFLFYYFIREAQ
ncbi:MAG: hypothetical protein J6A69_10050 [Clostridia bacterium]|nr:hypothetical protein [Clostridia bacterium]